MTDRNETVLPNSPAWKEAVSMGAQAVKNALEHPLRRGIEVALFHLTEHQKGNPDDKCALPTEWGTCDAYRRHHFLQSDHLFVETEQASGDDSHEGYTCREFADMYAASQLDLKDATESEADLNKRLMAIRTEIDGPFGLSMGSRLATHIRDILDAE